MTTLGRITSVTVEEDSKDVYVNVAVTPRSEGRRMRFLTPASGMWIVPQEGDIVEVTETDREFVARFPHSPPTFDMPSLDEGDFCFKFDDDTEIRVHRSGESYDIHITASGDVTLDGDSISLGNGGDPLMTGISVSKSSGYVTNVTPEYTSKTNAE